MYKRRCVVEGHSDFSSFIYYPRFVPPLNRKTHFSRYKILKNLDICLSKDWHPICYIISMILGQKQHIKLYILFFRFSVSISICIETKNHKKHPWDAFTEQEMGTYGKTAPQKNFQTPTLGCLHHKIIDSDVHWQFYGHFQIFHKQILCSGKTFK